MRKNSTIPTFATQLEQSGMVHRSTTKRMSQSVRLIHEFSDRWPLVNDRFLQPLIVPAKNMKDSDDLLPLEAIDNHCRLCVSLPILYEGLLINDRDRIYDVMQALLMRITAMDTSKTTAAHVSTNPGFSKCTHLSPYCLDLLSARLSKV